MQFCFYFGFMSDFHTDIQETTESPIEKMMIYSPSRFRQSFRRTFREITFRPTPRK